MRRAANEIADPGPGNIDPVWEHFESRCAYCRQKLSRERREGQVDHAEPDGGNQLRNLVLACGTCNGDEKREEAWREFLRRKVPDDAAFADREGRILAWFELHPRVRSQHSAEIVQLRKEIEDLIQEFAVKCGELKNLVREGN
jgi:hypothetical protein